MRTWRGKRAVLVVDDDESLRELVRTVLVEAGYEVRTAPNGRAALSLVAAMPPDVVLMDVNMPVLDGLTTCRLLRGDTRTRAVPVVIMSSQPVPREQLATCHVDRFLPKPFDLTRLVDEVECCAEPPAAD